jgi:hypothetical protein
LGERTNPYRVEEDEEDEDEGDEVDEEDDDEVLDPIDGCTEENVG